MKPKYKDILEEMQEVNPDALVVNGFDDCIIGICETFEGSKLLYSERKIIEKLAGEMTKKEALEYFEYNILGFYHGIYTPAFLIDL